MQPSTTLSHTEEKKKGNANLWVTSGDLYLLFLVRGGTPGTKNSNNHNHHNGDDTNRNDDNQKHITV